MKELRILRNRLMMLVMALLTSVWTYAQDGAAKIDVDINKGGGETWYNNPILWVVGIAVFILLFVAILRGGNSRSDA